MIIGKIQANRTITKTITRTETHKTENRYLNFVGRGVMVSDMDANSATPC